MRASHRKCANVLASIEHEVIVGTRLKSVRSMMRVVPVWMHNVLLLVWPTSSRESTLSLMPTVDSVPQRYSARCSCYRLKWILCWKHRDNREREREQLL